MKKVNTLVAVTKKEIVNGIYIDFEGNYKNNVKVGEWFYFSEEGVQDTIIKYNE